MPGATGFGPLEIGGIVLTAVAFGGLVVYCAQPNAFTRRLFGQPIRRGDLEAQYEQIRMGNVAPSRWDGLRPVYQFIGRNRFGQLVTKTITLGVNSPYFTKKPSDAAQSGMPVNINVASDYSPNIQIDEKVATPKKAKLTQPKTPPPKVNRPKNTPLREMNNKDRLAHVQVKFNKVIKPDVELLLNNYSNKVKHRALNMLETIHITRKDLKRGDWTTASIELMIAREELLKGLNDLEIKLGDRMSE